MAVFILFMGAFSTGLDKLGGMLPASLVEVWYYMKVGLGFIFLFLLAIGLGWSILDKKD